MILDIVILTMVLIIFFLRSWLNNILQYRRIRHNYPSDGFKEGNIRTKFEKHEWKKKFITNDYDIKYENITEDVLFRERSYFAIKNKRGIKEIYFSGDIIIYYSPFSFYADYKFLKNNPPLNDIERKRYNRDVVIDSILK